MKWRYRKAKIDMSVVDVWDTKGDLEQAIVSLFEGMISALSFQDQQTFQKARARVEIEVQLTPSGQRQMAPDVLTGLECDIENAFMATIRATTITEANPQIHTNFKCQVQHTLVRMPPLVNGISLLNHVAYPPMFYGGESYSVNPEKGYYRSVLTYSCKVSIHADAWKSVRPVTPPPPAPPPAPTPGIPVIILDDQQNIITDDQGNIITATP